MAPSLNDPEGWNPACKAWHFGPWAIEPGWFHAAIASVNAGLWAGRAGDSNPALPGGKLFQLHSGMAVIPVYGQIMKGESKFGGANSLAIRRQLQAAARDPEVKSIFMPVDSPGGTVAGTEELAATVRATAREKPLHAHVEDLGASAAYWAASQAGTLTASPGAQVGSIGVMAVLEDSTAAAEKAGVKVHVVKTGDLKAVGVPGTAILPSHLELLQAKVNEFGGQFLAGVAEGRRVSVEKAAEWSSGQTWIAGEAARMGLIDGVMRAGEAARRAMPEPSGGSAGAFGAVIEAQISGRKRLMAEILREKIRSARDSG